MNFRLETILWIILVGTGCQEQQPAGKSPSKPRAAQADDSVERRDPPASPPSSGATSTSGEATPAEVTPRFAVTFSGADPASWRASVRSVAGDHEYVFTGFDPGPGLVLKAPPAFGDDDLEIAVKADGSGATNGALKFQIRDVTAGSDLEHVEPWNVSAGVAGSTGVEASHPGLTIAMSAIELAVQLAKLGGSGQGADFEGDYDDEFTDDGDDEYY